MKRNESHASRGPSISFAPVKLRLRKVRAKWKRKLPDGPVLVRREYPRATLSVPSSLDVSDLVGKYFHVKRNGDKIIFERTE